MSEQTATRTTGDTSTWAVIKRSLDRSIPPSDISRSVPSNANKKTAQPRNTEPLVLPTRTSSVVTAHLSAWMKTMSAQPTA